MEQTNLLLVGTITNVNSITQRNKKDTMGGWLSPMAKCSLSNGLAGILTAGNLDGLLILPASGLSR